jgi:hypothetical protein
MTRKRQSATTPTCGTLDANRRTAPLGRECAGGIIFLKMGSLERGLPAYARDEKLGAIWMAAQQTLKSPFPWAGGKSDIAGEVWARIGANTENIVEPFCGSSAWLLARPGGAHGTETINDLDGFVVNALRAIAYQPHETAEHCDWPVSESCLTSTHLWLKAQRPDLTERLFADPFYCDPLVAGKWLWGVASWIGDGWCVADGPWINVDGVLVDRRTIGADVEGVVKQMPVVGSPGEGGERLQGIHRYRAGVPRKMPMVGRGPNSRFSDKPNGIQAKRYEGVPRQMPNVSASGSGSTGYGIFSPRFDPPAALLSYFAALSDRLRRVRFLCGDWRRAVKDSVTVNHGTTGVFLDPPYPSQEHGMLYHGDNDIWHQAAAWAVERGDDPRLRLAVCGYFSEATDALFPPSWSRYRWEARGGYSNQSKEGRGRQNAKRECCWFSPSCLNDIDDLPLFAQEATL